MMEDAFSTPVSPSPPPPPIAMSAARSDEGTGYHTGDAICQNDDGALGGEVSKTKNTETRQASCYSSAEAVDGARDAERSVGLGSGMNGSKSDVSKLTRRSADGIYRGSQAAAIPPSNGRERSSTSTSVDDDLEECGHGNNPRQASVACCLEDDNNSSIGFSAARPSPLAITGGSARGSGVLNSGRPVHNQQLIQQQQHMLQLQQQQLYVSPSSVPPSPVTGSAGSGMGFHITMPVGGGDGGSLLPPVARRSRANCIEDSIGRNGGGSGGFKKSYSVTEAVVSGGRLSARGMGSVKRCVWQRFNSRGVAGVQISTVFGEFYL